MAEFVDLLDAVTDDQDLLVLRDVVILSNEFESFQCMKTNKEVMEAESVKKVKRPRVFRERVNGFENYNDEEFKLHYRLSKDVTRFVINKIAADIESLTKRNQALSPSEMVLVTLRFLATGSARKPLTSVDRATGSRVIAKVLFALAKLRTEIIKMPITEEERTQVRVGFYRIARFPRCLGAVGYTFVKVIAPGGAEIYRNRKTSNTVKVQIVCDSQLNILDIVARWPASAHSSTIFQNSQLKERLENGEFANGLLLGDKCHDVKPYLITPLDNVVTEVENVFNEAQIRSRHCVNSCVEALKRRFPVLTVGIGLKNDKVSAVIVACAVLHNIACMMEDDVPDDVNEEVEQDISTVMTEEPLLVNNENNNTNNVDNIVRHNIINLYFESLLNSFDE